MDVDGAGGAGIPAEQEQTRCWTGIVRDALSSMVRRRSAIHGVLSSCRWPFSRNGPIIRARNQSTRKDACFRHLVLRRAAMLKSFLLFSAVVLVAFTPTPIQGAQGTRLADSRAHSPPPNATNPVKPTPESQAKAKGLYSIDCCDVPWRQRKRSVRCGQGYGPDDAGLHGCDDAGERTGLAIVRHHSQRQGQDAS